MNDLDQAIDRLSYAIQHEPTRRISFLFGAGISVPSVPGTAEMVSLLCDASGSYAEKLREDIRGLDAGAAYRMAAHELRQRRGEAGLARVIRSAVAQAYSGPSLPPAGSEDVPDDAWDLPAAQAGLAQLIATIPSQQRGPLFTTNFDPLTEAALRIRGVTPTTISAPSGAPIMLDSIYGTLPVVHLHGYWQNSATLSTGPQLIRPRPQVEEMLQRHLANSMMVVIGYSGWDDSFTRALNKVVEDGRWALMSGELLWMSYAGSASSPLVQNIEGSAGVNKYSNIDAADLFNGVCDALSSFHRTPQDAYRGWAPVPAPAEIELPSTAELKAFTEGAQPTWATAIALPRLDATTEATLKIGELLKTNHDGIIALSGPTGEGKTLGLMQACLDISASDESAVILVREPTAPPITSDWLAHLRAKAARTLIFIDEADLVLTELLASYAPTPDRGGSIGFVMALHSQYEQNLASHAALTSLPSNIVRFGGFSDADAISIATAWQSNGLLPEPYARAEIETVARLIADSGGSKHGASLFGAVLHLWMGDELEDRIAHLLARLVRTSIRGRTLRQLLCAVAVTQRAWDPDEEYLTGITLEILGDICELQSRDVIPLVISPLGREVGLAQIGERVYVRHPAIAEGIVNAISETPELSQIAFLVAEAGGRLRSEKGADREAWYSAYRLFQGLEGDAALAAAHGAVSGSPGRLEPRVSYLAVARKSGRLEHARKYSSKLFEKVNEYRDFRLYVRGLYVERAMIELADSNYSSAAGYACASLSDLDASPITSKQLRYGLVVAARASRALSVQNLKFEELYCAAMDLLARVPGADEVYDALHDYQATTGAVIGAVGRFRKASEPLGSRVVSPGEWRFTGLLKAIPAHSRKLSAAQLDSR